MKYTRFFLDGISDNMASLVESGKYVDINTTDTSTNGLDKQERYKPVNKCTYWPL